MLKSLGIVISTVFEWLFSLFSNSYFHCFEIVIFKLFLFIHIYKNKFIKTKSYVVLFQGITSDNFITLIILNTVNEMR